MRCEGPMHVYQFPRERCFCNKEPMPRGILSGIRRRSHILTHRDSILALVLALGGFLLIYLALEGSL